MTKLHYLELEDIEEREVIPGYRGRFIHSKSITTAYWDIDQGAAIPEHHHVHEQIVNVVSGQFEITIDGVTNVLTPGVVAVIPSDVPHSGVAITDCRIIDVFTPIREDYQ